MAAGNVIRIGTPIMVFSAWLLLLLISLSLPFIKPIWLLGLSSNPARIQPVTGVATDIRLGLWGYCASGYQFSSDGSAYFARDYFCSHPKAGFEIDPIVETLLGNNQIANVLLKGITYTLLLQPISCILAFFVFIPVMAQVFHPAVPLSIDIICLLLSILAALIETIDFVIVIVIVKVAQSRLSVATDNQFVLNWGPAVWMTLAATVCLWLGMIGISALTCGCCGLRSWRAQPKDFRDQEEKAYDNKS